MDFHTVDVMGPDVFLFDDPGAGLAEAEGRGLWVWVCVGWGGGDDKGDDFDGGLFGGDA